MFSDQSIRDLLTTRTAQRLGFLLGENEQERPRMPCRRPACANVIYRRTDKGRNKWFCGRPCADRFHAERDALDDAIDELAVLYSAEGASWRRRKDLESYLRYLLAARTAYFAPTDWTSRLGDRLRGDGDSRTQDLVEAWRYLARRPNERQPCPVCWGSGYIPSAPPPTPTSAVGQHRLVAGIANAFHQLLRQLIAIDSSIVPSQWLRDSADWAHHQRHELNRIVDWEEVSNPPRAAPEEALEVLRPVSD